MENRYFQWITGDRKGEVLVFDMIEQEGQDVFVKFKNGERMNTSFIAEINVTELTGKFMAEIEHPNNGWTFKERPQKAGTRVEQDWESQEKYEIPEVEDIMASDAEGVVKPKPKKKIIDLIPPRPTRNKFGRIASTDDMAASYNETINSQSLGPVATTQQPPVKQLDTSNPVFIMMEKSKKVDTEVNMTLVIQLPSSKLFDVIRDSFEDGDSKALKYIIENIDISDIKEALKAGIKEMYGPNEDPEDNKLKEFHSEKEIEHYKGYADYEPEVVEEPIIRDVSKKQMDEIQKSIDKQVNDITAKANKILVIKD